MCLFYIINTIIYENYDSDYNQDTSFIRGKVTNYKIDGDTLQLEINADEKVIVFYKFSTLDEKDEYIEQLKYGDIYDIYGKLEDPSTNTNFNLFSYKEYLLSKKIYYVMQADKLVFYKKSNSIFYRLKNKVHDYITKKDTFSYLSLFIFGDIDTLDTDALGIYRSLGISHLIAISGMHISLFSLLLLKLFSWIKAEWLRYSIVIFILWFYAFLVGFTPSMVRSVVSFTSISIFNLFNRNIKSFWILLLTALGFLLYNPFYIYSIGFLFSFVISFFLLFCQNLFSKFNNYFIKTFVVSLIAFFVSIPIISISFYEINLLSPVVNVIFVPFITFIVFPVSLFSFIMPITEPLFKFIITILEIMVSFCDKYFTISFIIPYMNFYVLFLYYLFLFYVLRFKTLKLLIFVFIFLIFFSYKKLFVSYYTVTALNVGQGDSLLLELPYNRLNVLIDTGGSIRYFKDEWHINNNSKGISDRTLIPYLKSIGVHKLNYLILTHGDYDHMGEAINLVENFKVEKVIFNCGEFNELEQDLIKVLVKKKILYYSCIKELNIDDNKLYFLNNKDYGNENDNSSVIYTELNNHKFLFMGDAGVEVEEDLIKKYNLTDIDVLKVGHHGSKTSSSKEFIDEINPKYSIISVGKNNRYGHPNKEVLDNLKDSKIYRTDEDGSIMFKIKNDKLKMETCAP